MDSSKSIKNLHKNLDNDYIINKRDKTNQNYNNFHPLKKNKIDGNINYDPLQKDDNINSIGNQYDNFSNNNINNKKNEILKFNKNNGENNKKSADNQSNYFAHRVPFASAVYLHISRRFYKKEIHADIVTKYHTSKLLHQIDGIKLIDNYITFIDKKKVTELFAIDTKLVDVIELSIKRLLSMTYLHCFLDIDDYKNVNNLGEKNINHIAKFENDDRNNNNNNNNNNNDDINKLNDQ